MPDGQQFDIEGARKAGYSDDQILAHLRVASSAASSFDVAGALKAGYSKGDVINELSKGRQQIARPSEAQQVAAGLPNAPGIAAPTSGVSPQFEGRVGQKRGSILPPALQVQPQQPTEKVMVQSGAAGIPIGLDVPQGYGPAVEAASNKGVQTGAAIGSTVAPIMAGGVAALPAMGRSILGAAGGGALGGYTGREIGGIFGPTGREVGGQIGSTIGGLAGGMAGARGIQVPPGKMGFLESLFAREPEALDPVEQAIKQKIASRIPLRLTKAQQEFLRAKVAETSPAMAADRPMLPNTPLVGTPEEIAAYEQRMRILNQEASDAGTYSAARGAINKKLNYQQRIKGRMEK